jgi:hypothetical protein
MEVRIGVLHTPKELELELSGTAADVESAFGDALKSEGVLWLTDTKGRRIGVPAERIAYLEMETDQEAKRVGFGAPA